MKKKYGIKAIKFLESNFFVNKDRVRELCQAMIDEKLDLKWTTDCRADYFSKQIDEDLLKLVKESGCVGLFIGIESGSPKILDLIKKDITREQAIKAAKMCRKYDIVPFFAFMMGFPGETRKDVMLTVDLMKKLRKEF